MIQPIFPIPEINKSHFQKNIPVSVSLFLNPKPKGGRPWIDVEC
jgi:hypothetical protein